ncbi:MAG TPA: DUF1844 domain-containing protein [Candidatus Binatia bacterium]|nr:DUF1844 domain-containing protein [Candidatus Binatia bacterium]
MAKDKSYPEKRDIRAIAILLATQGMIHLGEIADPLQGRKALHIEGARFFIDLLAELKRATQGNLTADENAFIGETLDNMQKVMHKKTAAANG